MASEQSDAMKKSCTVDDRPRNPRNGNRTGVVFLCAATGPTGFTPGAPEQVHPVTHYPFLRMREARLFSRDGSGTSGIVFLDPVANGNITPGSRCQREILIHL